MEPSVAAILPGGGRVMSNNDGPPDCWDEQIEVPPKASKKKYDDRRPILSADEEEARRLWVMAMRAHHQKRTGEPSNYDSNPAWDGGRCNNTGRVYHSSIWPAFVAKARSAGYSPGELIGVLFRSWASETSPTPHAATTHENIQRAARDRMLRKRRIAESLRTEESIYKADVWGVTQVIPDKREAIRFVLNDTSRILSPLFRYSVAKIANLDDVASRWEAAAVSQFQSDRDAYLEHWSALVPESMKQPASQAV